MLIIILSLLHILLIFYYNTNEQRNSKILQWYQRFWIYH